MPTLVQTLFDGPIDIVGDVHGEIAALTDLLDHLGYESNGDARGGHPENRRLVFVGDLTDRGPDSPAVVNLVKSLIEAGRAQCVLGNHDLNILLGHRKYDNPWFFGEEFRTKQGQLVPQVLADESVREMVLDFFRGLPIALERPGVRVIHAFWDPEMIEIARRYDSVELLYEDFEARLANEWERRHSTPANPVERELYFQDGNPVKLLTSGPERRAASPIESSGKTRYCERVEWWRNYAAPELCIFGHYGIPAGRERGRGGAFCIDYAAGKRSLERLAGINLFQTKLAALRLPERRIFFDDRTAEDWN